MKSHLRPGEVHGGTHRASGMVAGVYHFVRPHESLAEEMAQPVKRKGKQQPRKYRKRTPAMLAGLTDRPWTVKELLIYPLL